MNETPSIYRQITIKTINMKKIILIIISIIMMTFTGKAQKEVGTQQQIKDFFKRKTLIVIKEGGILDYNFKIKDVIKDQWNLTEYEFISEVEYEKKRMSSEYSFLSLDEVFYSKDKTKARYKFLCLTLGGKYRTEKEMPQLCSIPMSYLNAEEDEYVYKLGALINFIQNHMQLTSKNADLSSKNIISHYNKNRSNIKDKTLYVVKDELAKSINSEAKFKAVYPHDFKFATREEIETAIDSNDEKVVFLHKVGPPSSSKKARCWKVIMGASDAKLYYFDFHMINDKKPDGLLPSDLKKLSK